MNQRSLGYLLASVPSKNVPVLFWSSNGSLSSRPSDQAYFEGFGPKYVEWLSDWSFNVVFGDAEEAKNAAAAKSFALPELLPHDVAVRVLVTCLSELVIVVVVLIFFWCTARGLDI